MQATIAAARAEQQAGRAIVVDRYAEFQRRYWSDPAGFVRDCIAWTPGEGPASYQADIIQALVDHRRVSARGPHGLGKTSLSAWLILWFALTRDGRDWKIPTTASVWRQLEEFLWPEIHKWARRIRWDMIGRAPLVEDRELLVLSLSLTTGSAFALASDKPSAIEGAHADHMLYLFDEAKAIPSATFDAAEGALGTPGEIYVVAVSTPGDRAGRFFDIQMRAPGYEDWHVRHVTLAECIAAGRVSPEWADARRRQWGADSAEYQNRVEGNFAESEQPDGVIPRRWVKLAQARWRMLMDDYQAGRAIMPRFTGYGIDVGGEGESADATILAPRHAHFVAELIELRRLNTMQVAGAVSERLRIAPGRAVVDSIGVGAGVVARLRQLGHEVVAFNGAEGTDDHDSTGELDFANLRALAYWRMRERLDPTSGAFIALPPDPMLEDDLCAPTYSAQRNGRIVVEQKEKIKERLGRSPDRGDAVVMAFYEWSKPRPAQRGQPISVPTG